MLDLFDGVLVHSGARDHPEEMIREQPERLIRRFERYDPALGAYLEEYRNTSTGESCLYTSYIYTRRVVDMALAPRFTLGTRTEFEDGRLLGVYRRRNRRSSGRGALQAIPPYLSVFSRCLGKCASL